MQNTHLPPVSSQPPKLGFDLQGQLCGLEGHSPEALSQVTWVSVPSQQVLLISAPVPGKSKSQWQQALPYVFEEWVTQPIDQVFFKVLNRTAEGVTQVAVVDKHLMQTWIDTLQAAGLPQAQLIPECLTLPEPKPADEPATAPTTCWVQTTAFAEQDSQVVRTGRYTGFSGSPAWCAFMAQKQGVLFESIQILESVDSVILNRAQLKAFGLRDGVYQAKSVANVAYKTWLPVALAASLLALTLLGQTLWQTQQLEKNRQVLEAQTTQLFQQMFPDIKRIVNLKAQAKTALAQTSTEDNLGPTAIVQKVEQLLKNQPTIQVQSLSWRGQEMQLVLQANALAVLQTLEQQLKQNAAFKVRLEVQTLEASKVSARLVIHV
ncbi:type II secretion system protein GspL [Thiosulfativibrio zosterae]|uniref:Type II secretion system protein L n=1 Tax=Thiosulfativibrio zosterae TaxID=2675053 RepID=A0A6F8PKT6_9GAMM|nr:type II secretion system protein GspL [Thiosulfativibrio zosterae]BBP42674.1 hypothetical protein THMIRHAT_04200 [Thiosulfativibrio zosterae]